MTPTTDRPGPVSRLMLAGLAYVGSVLLAVVVSAPAGSPVTPGLAYIPR